MPKLTQENTMFDIPDLNRFRIGDEVIVDASQENDRFEGTIIGIELRRSVHGGPFETDITLLHDDYVTDGFKPADCHKVKDSPVSSLSGYQDRVAAAHGQLFDGDPTDIPERMARFMEEANETCQAFGMTREEAHALVDYTYGRPAGEPVKEVGSAMLTLASLCVVAGIDLAVAGEADLEKLQRPETIERIRAKRATRHGRGPLPGLDPAATEEEAECCEACGVRLEEGDLVYWAIDAGYLHAECCGPERESYCGPDGEPLKDDEPIPEPAVWSALR